ncbi:MAG: redox-regulated molecular chaperone Hsp33, partial [Pseudomonadales bacterium]
MNQDHRQRFFIKDSPVRGDAVRLSRSYATIIAQKDYPEAIKQLLGEMLVSASLLIGTLKIEGRLSIQLQSSDDNSNDGSSDSGLLKWAMAECDHEGNLRALADWKQDTPAQQQAWTQMTTANEAFKQLGELNKGVMFINIQPLENGHKSGQAYQGIVERSHDNLADCLAHYQKQSAQIPTIIKLACDGLQAGGLLVQLLPLSQEEQMIEEQAKNAGDDDLWTRLSVLTNTI